MASIVSTHKKIKNDRRKWKCQLTFLFRRLFLTSLCCCVYGCKGMGHVGEVWVFDRSVLCSWECLQKETEKRGRGKTVKEFQFQFQTVAVCFSFEETEERASCWGSFWHVGLKKWRRLGTTFPPKAQHGTVLGINIFPPKAQHGTILGIYISLQKPNTAPFWGPFSPQKPTRRHFGDQVSHQISYVGPAFFLSFLVFFLFWFGLSGLMGLGFFSTSDINVCIMGYYMTMDLGFFFFNLRY